jgi:FKBP-type peptidyl-prolyl cis-trans isomerase
MKQVFLLIATIGLFCSTISAQSLTKKQIDKLSYGIGVLFCIESQDGVSFVDTEVCRKGLKDGFTPDIARLKQLDYLNDSLRVKDKFLMTKEAYDQIEYGKAYKFTAKLMRYEAVSLADFDMKMMQEGIRDLQEGRKLRYNHLECINAYEAYFLPKQYTYLKKSWSATYRHDLSYAYGEYMGSNIRGHEFPCKERYVNSMIEGFKESFLMDTVDVIKESGFNRTAKNRWNENVNKFYSIQDSYGEVTAEELLSRWDTVYYTIGVTSIFGQHAQLFDMTIHKEDFDLEVVKQGVWDYVNDTTRNPHDYKQDSILIDYSVPILARYYRYTDMLEDYFDEKGYAFLNYACGALLAKNFEAVSPSNYQIVSTAFEKGLKLDIIEDLDSYQEADIIFDKLKNVELTEMDANQLSEWAYAIGVNNKLSTSFNINYKFPSVMKGFKAALNKEKLAYTKEEIVAVVNGSIENFDTYYTERMNNRENLGYAYGMRAADYLSQHNFTKEEHDVDKLLEGIEASLTLDSVAYKKLLQLIEARLESKEPSKTEKEAKEVAFAHGACTIFGSYVQAQMYVIGSELNFTSYKNGYQAFLNKDPLMLTIEEADELILRRRKSLEGRYQKALEYKKNRYKANHYESTIVASNVFLKAQDRRKGVRKSYYSNTCYEVIKEGKSDLKPLSKYDEITIVCKTTTYDGKVFENPLLPNGKTVTVAIREFEIEAIRTWIESMTVGSKYRFYIDSKDAYYLEGLEGQVLPGSAVVYEIELLDVKHN